MLSAQRKQRLASVGARLGALSVSGDLQGLSDEHGVPPVVLSQMVITLGQLVLVPEEIALEHGVFPFDAGDDGVLLAMATPWERDVVEEMEFLTGKQVVPYVALPDDIRATIPAAYEAHGRGDALFAGADVSPEERDAVGLPPCSEVMPARPQEGVVEIASAMGDAHGSEDAEPAPVAIPPAAAVPAAVIAVAPQVIGMEVAPSPPSPPAANESEPEDSPPLDPAFSEPPEVTVAAATEVDLSDRSLLVADPQGEVSQVLQDYLAAVGVTLHSAATGPEAIIGVRDQRPDVLVLDASLPEIHGLEVCRRLRGQERFAKLPIIVFGDKGAGWRLEADLRDCFGVTALFEKPAELQEMARAVVRILRGQPAAAIPGPIGSGAEAELRAGMAAFEGGDLDRAIAHLEAGVRLEPTAFQLQYHLGLLYGRREDLFPAIQALEAATRLQKCHFSALKNLAVVYQRARFHRKAFDTWERAMWTAPDEETRRTIKNHMVTLL